MANGCLSPTAKGAPCGPCRSIRPGSAETLVGLTGTLFDFGDVDGQGDEVRLQHPLDVAWADGKLYVADTYNNKIKVIDVGKRTCRTIAGTGKPGNADGDGATATFNEPGGISAAGGKLYVADTNNHAIRIVELAAPFRVTTMKIDGLAAPAKISRRSNNIVERDSDVAPTPLNVASPLPPSGLCLLKCRHG